MGLHTAAELAAFTNGELRMLYAARRDSGELVYLEDGTAKAMRATTKTDLRCPVEGCTDPELTTVARAPARRDGYRHLHVVSGATHAEGVFHIQAKALILDWLRHTHPRSTAALEVPIDQARTRIADVMVTAPSGERVAFEIQYASLHADEWHARHDDYRRAGIVDVWIFGHVGAQMRRSRGGQVNLSALQQAVAEFGPVLWMNPADGTLAAAVATRVERTRDGWVRTFATARSGSHVVDLALFPLASAHVAANGLSVPRLTELARVRTEWDEEDRAAAEAAAAARADVLLHNTSVRQFMARVKSKMARRGNEWMRSGERAALLERFGGQWPAFLNVMPKRLGYSQEVILLPWPFAQWEAILYRQFIADVKPLTRVTIRSCAAYLASLDNDVRYHREAVSFWFHALTKAGVLIRPANARGPFYYTTGDSPGAARA